MRILCILCTGLRTMMILVSHILIIVRVSFVFDEDSWQSTNWPWSCLSDRVMTLFWATLTSLLTGSHQRSSKSSQAWNLSRIRILSGGISPAQNLTWWDQRVFWECASKIWKHFQTPWLKFTQWKVSQCNRVESKRFRVRVENSQICLCWGSHHVTGQRLSRPYRHQVVT